VAVGLDDDQAFVRGDVVLVPFPLITDLRQLKPRPAIVVQNDVGNRFSPNVIVVAVSSRVPDKDYPINLRLPAGTAGLDRDSVVLGGVILTILKSYVIRKLGSLSAAELRSLDACLRVSLGL
jgi:mRNA interferase MazF